MALDVWARLVEETKRANEEEPDAFGVLVRYLHRCLELRAGSLFPVLVADLEGEADIARAREEAAGALRATVPGRTNKAPYGPTSTSATSG